MVRIDDVVRRALRRDPTLVEPNGSIAESRHRAEVVGHEDDGLALRAELADLREAFVLEVLVADRENLVHEQHVRVEVHRDRKAEPHVHAGRIGLHVRVEEAAEVGEVLDRGHDPVDLGSLEPEQRPVEVRVLAAAEVGMKARADLEQRRDASVHLEHARTRLRGSGEELEQRGFARAVRADHAERTALIDGEAHVAERLHFLARRVLAQHGFLQRAAALAPEPVGLREVLGTDGHSHGSLLTVGTQRDRSGAGRLWLE